MPLGPELPEFESETLVEGNNPPFNLTSAEEQNPRLRKTGDHKIERFKKLISEWIPDDKGAIKFRDQVLEELERLVNDEPDFDTGYFKVEAGYNYYTMEHGLGRIPTRSIIYIGTQDTDEPSGNLSGVYEQGSHFDTIWNGASNESRGTYLIHSMDGSETRLLTGGDYVASDVTSAYVRVLFWR